MMQLRPRSAVKNKQSLIITLPIIWRENAKIKAGDKIPCFVDVAGNLVIQKVKR
jgi:bifunctional DNA-binding transcriptional regulator/antitoxin component of YhaV-PrlF toxin-antitoxin module